MLLFHSLPRMDITLDDVTRKPDAFLHRGDASRGSFMARSTLDDGLFDYLQVGADADGSAEFMPKLASGSPLPSDHPL